jgi:hypothetical protein
VQHSETGGRLRRVLELEAELAGSREEAAQREAELREQLERLRHDTKEVEARQAGVDLVQMQVGEAWHHMVLRCWCWCCCAWRCEGRRAQQVLHCGMMLCAAREYMPGIWACLQLAGKVMLSVL